MCHADPSVKHTLIKNNRFLEVLSRDLIFLAVEVVGAHSEPTHRMRGVVLDQVVRAVIQLTCQAQIQQTGGIDR